MKNPDAKNILSLSALYYTAIKSDLSLTNIIKKADEIRNISTTDLYDLLSSSISGKYLNWVDKCAQYRKSIYSMGLPNDGKLIFELPENHIQKTNLFKVIAAINDRNIEILTLLNSQTDTNFINSRLAEIEDKIQLFNDLELNDKKEESSSKITEEVQPASLKIPSDLHSEIITLLQAYTTPSSQNDVKLLIEGFQPSEIIQFNLPANSLIDFFKSLHNNVQIYNTKSEIGKIILNNFHFKSGNEYKQTSKDNIKNYLTRTNPPSGIQHPLILRSS